MRRLDFLFILKTPLVLELTLSVIVIIESSKYRDVD